MTKRERKGIGQMVTPYRKLPKIREGQVPLTREVQQLIFNVQKEYEYSVEHLALTLGVTSVCVLTWRNGKVKSLHQTHVARMEKMLRDKKSWVKARGH